MEIFWFCVVATMVTIYAILDGYDLGAGMVSLLLAKTDDERHQILESIHPLWDGNEVWLIAGGTSLYFAFPRLYASSFSGFYLALMIALWLLVLRGISIEFRNVIDSRAWKPFWDKIFGWASAVLALVFGAALGNVIRGVPFDASGFFFLPLWTDFRDIRQAGVLDWYTGSIGVAAILTLLVHGALWVALRTVGDIEHRSRRLANRAWPILGAVTLWITFLSFRVQPQLSASFRERPWGVVFPAIAILSFIALRFWNSERYAVRVFASSCIFIFGMLTSAAFSVFPLVLPSTTDPAHALTIYNSAAPMEGLRIGQYWFIPGIALAMVYSAFAHWKFSHKVSARREEH